MTLKRKKLEFIYYCRRINDNCCSTVQTTITTQRLIHPLHKFYDSYSSLNSDLIKLSTWVFKCKTSQIRTIFKIYK